MSIYRARARQVGKQQTEWADQKKKVSPSAVAWWILGKSEAPPWSGRKERMAEMLKSKQCWIIVIEDLNTAAEFVLQDRYCHGPEKFYSRGDAVRRAAKINGKTHCTGQRAWVEEHTETPKPPHVARA